MKRLDFLPWIHSYAASAGVALLLLLGACNPVIDVLAPEKEIFVVYGVLDPGKSEQYIKVSKVFQFEGDAYTYAAQNDLSLQGLEVTVEGNGKSYTAEQVNDQPKDDGIFLATQTLYKFTTTGADTLRENEVYTLHIRRPGDDTFHLTAWTRIPGEPEITSPAGPFLLQSGLYVLPMVEFSEDVTVYFKRSTGKGFEVRMFVNFLEDGQPRQARYGPTKLFTKPVNCSETASGMCYQVADNEALVDLKSDLDKISGIITYEEGKIKSFDPDSLSRSCWLETTAVDSFLTLYLSANDPFGFGLNMLMDKPEISNIAGGNAVGIFGSIHRSISYIALGECSKQLSGLVNPLFPIEECSW